MGLTTSNFLKADSVACEFQGTIPTRASLKWLMPAEENPNSSSSKYIHTIHQEDLDLSNQKGMRASQLNYETPTAGFGQHIFFWWIVSLGITLYVTFSYPKILHNIAK